MEATRLMEATAWFTVKCLVNMKWHFNTNAADEIF